MDASKIANSARAEPRKVQAKRKMDIGNGRHQSAEKYLENGNVHTLDCVAAESRSFHTHTMTKSYTPPHLLPHTPLTRPSKCKCKHTTTHGRTHVHTHTATEFCHTFISRWCFFLWALPFSHRSNYKLQHLRLTISPANLYLVTTRSSAMVFSTISFSSAISCLLVFL